MKYNPKHNGNSYMGKLVKYEDEKNWKRLLGSE